MREPKKWQEDVLYRDYHQQALPYATRSWGFLDRPHRWGPVAQVIDVILIHATKWPLNIVVVPVIGVFGIRIIVENILALIDMLSK